MNDRTNDRHFGDLLEKFWESYGRDYGRTIMTSGAPEIPFTPTTPNPTPKARKSQNLYSVRSVGQKAIFLLLSTHDVTNLGTRMIIVFIYCHAFFVFLCNYTKIPLPQ